MHRVRRAGCGWSRIDRRKEAMSFLSQAYLLEKYGPRIAMQDLAKVLGIAHGTLRNRIGAGTFTVPTYLDGGTRYADYRDVAEYLDGCRERARASSSRISSDFASLDAR